MSLELKAAVGTKSLRKYVINAFGRSQSIAKNVSSNGQTVDDLGYPYFGKPLNFNDQLQPRELRVVAPQQLFEALLPFLRCAWRRRWFRPETESHRRNAHDVTGARPRGVWRF